MTSSSSTANKVGNQLSLSIWCVVAAFGAYFCTYGFRKPFTAGQYADVALWGIGYKTVLVTSQVLGYTLSKVIGIKIIAEMPPRRRAGFMLGLIAAAQTALLLFGLVAPPWNFLFLFFNGLPLGMVFGLVLGFLEGRRQSEALTAGLCASFVLADGVTKSVGAYVLQGGISEFWMPFTSGLLFTPWLLFFVWMLSRIPAPTLEDVTARSERVPMDRDDRRRFLRRHAVGLMPLLTIYLLITILRSVRADFAPEIWSGLGISDNAGIFTRSEVFVALGVLTLNGSVALLRDNHQAFFAGLFLSGIGPLLILLALVGLQLTMLSAFAFMVLIGLGLYLPYIAIHTTLFERLIAMTRDRGNIGYLMYLADSIGYLGYVAVMFGRNLLTVSGQFLDFFLNLSWGLAVVSLVLIFPSWFNYRKRPT